MSRIVSLTAENVKRLQAVTIKPDGSVVTISGRNAQGKSSVLDSIVYALGGKSVQPTKPIREGQEAAQVVLETEDIIITRRWTANDKSTLTVESRDGARYPSPQTVLDKLTGELSFDPIAFSRMPAKEQVATLKRVAGLDFTALDTKRDVAFVERTAVNRDVRIVREKLGPEVVAPDEEVSIAALSRQFSDARAAEAAKRNKEREAGDAQRDAKEADRAVTILRSQLAQAEKSAEASAASAKALTAEANGMTVPDIAAIQQQMESAEGINRAVRAKKDRAEASTRLANLEARAAGFTKTIEGIDAEKIQTLAAAKMPVPGLGFDADGVTFNGVPFSQCSSAEQLRVSVAMGLSLNPKLRVMLIRDGSLLDAEGMKLIGELAEQYDAQVWIERVSDGDAVGVVIEDGMVEALAHADH